MSCLDALSPPPHRFKTGLLPVWQPLVLLAVR